MLNIMKPTKKTTKIKKQQTTKRIHGRKSSRK
jgi:hypothetical protein